MHNMENAWVHSLWYENQFLRNILLHLNEEKKKLMKILTYREKLDTTWLLMLKRVWDDTKYLAVYSVYLV